MKKISPYSGKHSFLTKLTEAGITPKGKILGCWRWGLGKNRKRLRAIKELAAHLQKRGIKEAAGPVLSGALFAQTIEDNSNIKAGYLPKKGYKPEKHEQDATTSAPWVFVDDIIATGLSLKRAAQYVEDIPEAVIVFECVSNSVMPITWKGVPVYMLTVR